jgi:hypothetical protein
MTDLLELMKWLRPASGRAYPARVCLLMAALRAKLILAGFLGESLFRAFPRF